MIRVPVLLVCAIVFMFATTTASVRGKTKRVRVQSRGFINRNGNRGAVYAMSNKLSQNSIIAYVRNARDQFVFLGEFATGGRGGILDNGDGSNPLISQNSVVVTPNKRFLLTVNAGSNSVTVFRILPNFRLRIVSIRRVFGKGPMAIAVHPRGSLVYVASADADGKNAAPASAMGALTGFVLNRHGQLFRIRRSFRQLPTRPGDVVFAVDGNSIVVASNNPFSDQLPRTSEAILSYRVLRGGRLTRLPVDGASSTRPGMPKGRSPPVIIGIDIVRVRGVQYVVVPEIRPMQTGSVSTFRLDHRGRLRLVQADVLTGNSINDGEQAACWIVFNSKKDKFFVSNTATDTVSTFQFKRGRSTLLKAVAASGQSSLDGAIDMAISPDDKFLFVHGGVQGEVGVFRIRNNGANLEFVKNLAALPDRNTQGVVAI